MPSQCLHDLLINEEAWEAFNWLPDCVREASISIRGFAASEDETEEWSIVQDLGANED